MSGLVGNPFLLASAAGGATGYQIERSLRFNSSDSASCSRSFTSAGNRRTWTLSLWVKRSAIAFSAEQHIWGVTGTTDATYGEMFFGTGDTLRFAVGYNTTYGITTTRVFRDPSAWYHIVLAFDATQSTAANKIKLYINGVEETTFSSDTRSSIANQDWGYNNNVAHYIGRQANSDIRQFNGYLADIHFIDGQALTPSSFTEVSATTGQLIPKAYTGTFTGNSFWLKFADNSAATATTLGKDSSGLGNNWTPNNLSVTAGAGNDSLVDTPTSYGTDDGLGGSVRGNYATLNPLDKGSGPTLANGNLDVTGTAGVVRGTMFMPSGKWYFEGTLTALGNSGNNTPRFGVANAAEPIATSDAGSSNNVASIICSPNATFGGRGIRGGTTVGTGNPFAAGDVAMVAYDADTGNIWFGKNGTWINSGNPATGASPTFTGLTAPYAPLAQTDPAGFYCNFGQRPFAYTAPSGFKALCTTNLPAPVVAKPNTAFDAVPYTGSSGSQNITTNFSPDLVWVKTRNSTTEHELYDTVRGAGVRLSSNVTLAENNLGANGLTSFNSNGFTVPSTANYGINGSGYTYAAWAWDAGTTTSSNGSGSITSQVRANASSGFSVVSWSGVAGANGTIGHGLGVAPQFVILKNRGTADNWRVYHVSVGATGFLQLASTGATVTSDEFQNTSPTSSVFYLRGNTWNAASNNYIAYFFAPVAGYSSFGSYTGNGSADGPFVFCGFRPRFLLIKVYSGDTGAWRIYDSSRNTYNVVDLELNPNSSGAEYTASNTVDFTSNGFKIRTSNINVNLNTAGFIYAAFAESPFQYARAR